MIRRLSTALTVLLLSACAQQADYTLVLLKTGPRSNEVKGAEAQKVMGGHLGNIQRLFREGALLVAGPYGKEKSDALLRGLFVLDTGDRARAEALARTDPGFAAGVFAFDYHSLGTAAPLREYAALELRAEDEATRAGRPQAMGEGMRGFVILVAEDGEAAADALEGNPAVLCFATLDDSGAFVLLDAPDLPAAKALLSPIVTKLGRHTLDEWYASGRLVELRTLVRSR